MDYSVIVTEDVRISGEVSLEDIALKFPPKGWEETFKKCLPELKHIDRLLKGKDVFPKREWMFSAFHACPKNRVKVIILGQDPYHTLNDDGTPQACGMAFATRKLYPIQPSLRNIYSELEREFPDHFVKPDHGFLSWWAHQGVLLLNTSLTVEQGSPGCHDGMWNGFISKIFEDIEAVNPQVIYMCWGRSAIKYAKDMSGKNSIKLVASHPSPLSWKRGINRGEISPFLGCGHFSKANELLAKRGLRTIDWNVDQPLPLE